MIILLAMLAALPEKPDAMRIGRQVTVDRRQFDCFSRAATRLRKPRGSVFYLDLRRCPPALRAPDRLGSFPNWEMQSATASGNPVNSVVLLTDNDFKCLRSRAGLARVRRVLDSERYLIMLDRC